MEKVQAAFTGGELSPSLYGRTDLNRFQLSLKLCRNYIIQPNGGAKNRGGTKYVAVGKTAGKKVRMVPFSFSTVDTCMLEFGHLYIRVHRNGEPIVYPTGHASAGQPVEIVTPYTEAELFELDYKQSADVLFIAHPAHQPQRLERSSIYSWQLIDAPFKLGPWGPLNVDTTLTIGVAAAGAIGTDTTISASQPIFTTDNVGQLIKLESQNFEQPWEPGKSVTTGDVRRSDGKYYKALTSGTTGTLRPVQESDNWNDGAVNWQFLHYGYGVLELKEPVTNGGMTMAATIKTNIPTGTLGVISGGSTPKAISDITVVGSDTHFEVTGHGIGIAGVTASIPWAVNIEVYDPELDRTYWLRYRGTDVATVVDADNIKFVGKPDLVPGFDPADTWNGTVTTGGASTTGGTNVWNWGAWSDVLGWPGSVTLYQQRLIYAGSPKYPTTLWLSRTDSYDDFGQSNPLQADDAIAYTIASGELNQVQSLVALKKLMAITSGGVWVFNTGQEDVITPTNIAASLEAYEGGANQRVLGIGRSAIYLQDKGAIPRDLAYVFSEDGYVASDMSIMAGHLFSKHTIVDWAYQSHPFKIIWAVRDDGIMLGCTYMREQEVIGWHRHDTYNNQGQSIIESVACVTEGTEDAIYLAVNRKLADNTWVRHIERMADRDAAEYFLDCYGQSTAVTAGTAVIPHLAYEQVTAMTGDVTTAAEVTLTLSNLGVVPTLAGVVTAGFPITSDMELLDINDQGSPTRTGNKIVTAVNFLIGEDSSKAGLYAGASYTTLFPVDLESSDDYFADGTLSGIGKVIIQSAWGRRGRVVIRNTKAKPQEILAVIPEVSYGA